MTEARVERQVLIQTAFSERDPNHPGWDVSALFQGGQEYAPALICARGRRSLRILPGDVHVIRDEFATGEACCFARVTLENEGSLKLRLAGDYTIDTCPLGGWLASPADASLAVYWIPQPAAARRVDGDGHVLGQERAEISGFSSRRSETAIELRVPAGHCLDLVVWQLPPSDRTLAMELSQAETLEKQPFFLWSSHTCYGGASDLYLHLLFGHIYENHAVWPRYWRVCSELDAWALYVILAGLERATGKRLYGLLKRQVVLSVVARQAEDGGWYHGEWTRAMESHYRLVNAAVLMLAAYLEEDNDGRVRTSLEKGAAFLVNRTHKLDAGAWFLHDSLEGNTEGIRQYPFAWSSSTALGKATSNLLVLNTHLDSIIALDRYARATGDEQYAAIGRSARQAALVVLGLGPAEWLYRQIFRILDLTLLPKAQAVALPAYLRAVKRAGWKYLVPILHRIKAIFPRLVMPNGFVDRGLCQRGFSTRYQSVNVWDLVRYLGCFADSGIGQILDRALDYTYRGPIRPHWKEDPTRHDALGLWAEALYRLCMIDPEPKYRCWLAEAILDCEEVGIGLPPSCLGANAEALALSEQQPCPSPSDSRLRVVNLGRGDIVELLIINPKSETMQLVWQRAPKRALAWIGSDHSPTTPESEAPSVPGHGWLLGKAHPGAS